ncbi:MAG TPA: hypothetical protein VJQ57_13725 [Acidimicrobiia bacterium]|nr:hypothetical protein [Acidimicrobiia bacterium]
MASTEAQVSMNGVSAVGAGTTVDFTTAKRCVTAVVVPSATLSAGIVLIEASQDSVNWVIEHVIDMSGRSNHSVCSAGVAFRYWRANIARTVGGGTVRVTFMEAD